VQTDLFGLVNNKTTNESRNIALDIYEVRGTLAKEVGTADKSRKDRHRAKI
jgi:hypothetical protein